MFTAFSGSHQDAIKKGLGRVGTATAARIGTCRISRSIRADIGREYREVIRVNSQSGKGGVAYLLESEFGIELPKDMQREFGPIANDEVDQLGREVSGAELKAMFWREYIERSAAVAAEGLRDRKPKRHREMPRAVAARRQAGGVLRRRQRPARRARPRLQHRPACRASRSPITASTR